MEPVNVLLYECGQQKKKHTKLRNVEKCNGIQLGMNHEYCVPSQILREQTNDQQIQGNPKEIHRC